MRQNNDVALVAIAASLWLGSFSLWGLQRAGAAAYEEAKKEQEVVFYTSLNLEVAQPLGEAFTAKYPGVKVQVNRQGSDSLVPKLLTERRVAKKDSADVVLTGSDSFDMMLTEVPDIFQKYSSPERKPEDGVSTARCTSRSRRLPIIREQLRAIISRSATPICYATVGREKERLISTTLPGFIRC